MVDPPPGWLPLLRAPSGFRCDRSSSGLCDRSVKLTRRRRTAITDAPGLRSNCVRHRLVNLKLQRVGDLLQSLNPDAGIAVGLPALDLLLGDAELFGELALRQARRDPRLSAIGSSGSECNVRCATRPDRSSS